MSERIICIWEDKFCSWIWILFDCIAWVGELCFYYHFAFSFWYFSGGL